MFNICLGFWYRNTSRNKRSWMLLLLTFFCFDPFMCSQQRAQRRTLFTVFCGCCFFFRWRIPKGWISIHIVKLWNGTICGCWQLWKRRIIMLTLLASRFVVRPSYLLMLRFHWSRSDNEMPKACHAPCFFSCQPLWDASKMALSCLSLCLNCGVDF